jgi:lipoprotein-anchoring transpeptidase ErfK/SrfK
MSLTRRTFIITAACALATPSRAAEPFPVNMIEGRNLDYKYQRRDMEFATSEPAGTIVVDAVHRFLYHVQNGGMATRYGVAVGKSTHAWTGEVIIKKMKEWPVWIPAPYHLKLKPSLAQYVPNGMPGGPENPLGARAMYLYKGETDTINRIHGAAKLNEIGKKATAGCIGMLNVDIIHLYANVQIGTRVVMLG